MDTIYIFVFAQLLFAYLQVRYYITFYYIIYI